MADGAAAPVLTHMPRRMPSFGLDGCRRSVRWRRFDANSYLTLTRMMDSHDVSRGRGSYPEVLGLVTQPTLVVGISSDVLYPLREQQVTERPRGRVRARETPHV